MTVFRLICISLLFGIPVSAQSLLDHTDNQQWNEVQFFFPVTKQIDFTLGGTLRLGRDFTQPVDERIGAGFSFKLGQYVTVSPNYQHIGMQPFAGRRVWENRLSVPAQVRINVGQFRLTDRSLFERRWRNSGLKTNRYRQRLTIEHAVGPAKLALSLFIADEVFYDWAVGRWVRNRFSVGAIKVFNKHFTQEFYYLRQNDGISIPGDLNVLGTLIRFRL